MSTRHQRSDEGSVLVLVLVMMLIGALIVLPMMSYASSVFRASDVQVRKARAVELARGGTWVALSDGSSLYNKCNGGPLLSALDGVTTTCQVLASVTLRDPADMPYEVAAVQSDVTVQPIIASSGVYPSPNSTSVDPDGWDDWLATPDWSTDTVAGKVWLPQLPVQPTSSGGTRDTDMTPGTQDPSYASCRVFFPGTFTAPITIAEPAYFTSGVYYFTEPITLESGADVVVGNGSYGGCTTDFEAIANAEDVPDPLNMSGLGGTFVLGENARIVVDDSAGTAVRFAMNQRYVSEDETSVLASSNVSIVSVNGTHAPFVGPETLGDDLLVDGVIAVPASTVGTDGDPLATDSDYDPSVLTPKPTEPDAPTNVVATPVRIGGNTWDGAATVSWDVPNNNGSLITNYTVVGDRDGVWCSPPAPTLPDTTVQPSCTVTGMRHNRTYTFTVVATNDVGDTTSASTSGVKARTTSNPRSPYIVDASAPQNVALGTAYSDGIEVMWDPPADDGGSPITHSHVTATPVVPGPPVTCDAWWDETSCVLSVADGLVPAGAYTIKVEAVQEYDGSEHFGAPAYVDGLPADLLPPEPDPVVVILGSSPAPVQEPATAAIRVPNAILDFSTSSAATVTVRIAGYVAVPQGHIRLDAAVPAGKTVVMTGGVTAGQFRLDGSPPAVLDIRFDNPVAQKRMRIRSTATVDYRAVSDIVVQLNKSGSLAINSWVIQ